MAQGGRNSTPPAFLPSVCSGGPMFLRGGGSTPTTPANFYTGLGQNMGRDGVMLTANEFVFYFLESLRLCQFW